MGGKSSKSRHPNQGPEFSLRQRVRRIIDEETPDEDMSNFKFIGLEHVVGQEPVPAEETPQGNCCLRLLWALLIMACVATCVYQIWERIDYFYTYPTMLMVEVDQRQNVSFPTITICSDPGATKRIKQTLAQNFGGNACDYLDVDIVDKALFGRKRSNAVRLWMSLLNSVGRIRRVIDALNVRFKIPKVDMEGLKDTPVDTPFGRCVQAKTELPTIKYQGTLTAIVYSISGVDACTYPSIILGSHGNYLDPGTARPLASGQLVALPIKMQEFKGLRTPTNPCVSEAEYWDCMIPCYENLMIDTMECKLPYMLNVTKPFCNTSATARQAYKDSLKIMRQKYLEVTCKCTKRCDEVTYIIRLETIALFPPVIIVYYPTSLVEVSREILAYNIDQLVCDIGGNLGLFLGFCILSLMDSLQLFVDTVKKKLCPKRKKGGKKIQPGAVEPLFSPPALPPQNGGMAPVALKNQPHIARR